MFETDPAVAPPAADPTRDRIPRGSFGSDRGSPGPDRGSFGSDRGSPGPDRGPLGSDRGYLGSDPAYEPAPRPPRRYLHDDDQQETRHLRAVPPEGPRGMSSDNPEADVTAAFRGEVVSRLRRFSVLHTRHAWERRRRDPLSPHGIALFYLERGVPVLQQLRTATRIFLADDEANELPMLLYGLARHAHEGYQADPAFDPRTMMANKCDPMSSAAVFAGIGVCTLDTPYGPWSDAQRQAANEFDLPGRCFARLIDGTRLLLDRGGRKQFNGLTVESSVDDTNAHYGVPSMQWRWNPSLAEIEQHDPTYHVWRWMSELGRIIDVRSQPR